MYFSIYDWLQTSIEKFLLHCLTNLNCGPNDDVTGLRFLSNNEPMRRARRESLVWLMIYNCLFISLLSYRDQSISLKTIILAYITIPDWDVLWVQPLITGQSGYVMTPIMKLKVNHQSWIFFILKIDQI